MVDSDAVQSELQDYLKQHGINTLFISIVESLLLSKPSNPIQAIVDHLYQHFPDQLRPIGGPGGGAGASAGGAGGPPSVAVNPPAEAEYSDTESDSGDEMGELHDVAPVQRSARRVSVSAESVDPTKMSMEAAPVHPKTAAEEANIRQLLSKNLLFSQLEDSQLTTVVNAMFPVHKEPADVIITQGEVGDNFYVVDSGVIEIFVNDSLVQTCTTAMSFGELALLYNTPRAATVKAKTASSLWALDRSTFKRTLMQAAIERQTVNAGFLAQVPILESLSDSERDVVGDALHALHYNEGDVVIREGDSGDTFYIVEEGIAVCTKAAADGSQVEVARLESGAFFGEIALLSSRPRQATVTAAGGPLKVLTLDRATFRRVMGPLDDILKRHMETYNSVMAQGI